MSLYLVHFFVGCGQDHRASSPFAVFHPCAFSAVCRWVMGSWLARARSREAIVTSLIGRLLSRRCGGRSGG
jgi:hypothetical protein